MKWFHSRTYYPFLKLGFKLFLGVLLVFIAIVLFIRSPKGQQLLVSKITTYVTNKTGATFSIDKLYITFTGNLLVKELYLEDQQNDTLVYSHKIEADIGLLSLLRNTSDLRINYLDWQGLKVNISKEEKTDHFNFQFLVDSLAATDTIQSAEASTASPLKLALKKIKLKNIDVVFNDQVAGIFSDNKFEELQLKKALINLDEMAFEISDFNLKDAKIKFHQTKVNDTTDTATENIQPVIKLHGSTLSNVHVDYANIPSQQKANGFIETFTIDAQLIDLKQQIVTLDELSLSDSKFEYRLFSPTDETNAPSTGAFNWPQWNVITKKINLSNNAISYQNKAAIFTPNKFDPNNLEVKNLSLSTEDIVLMNEKLDGKITSFHFKERSGFTLSNLSTKFQLRNQNALLENIFGATNHNSFQGSISLDYTSINDFINTPNKTQFDIRLKNLNLNPKDAFYFQPELKQNTSISALATKNIKGNIHLSGSLQQLAIDNTQLHWGSQTNISVAGNIKNAQTPKTAYIDLNQFEVNASNNDLNVFIAEENKSLQLPQKIQLKGAVKGVLDNFNSDILLTTSNGNIKFNGTLKNRETIGLNAAISITDLDLKSILNNEKLGVYTFSTNIKGTGSNLSTLSGSLSATFDRLPFNNVDYNALQLSGKLVNGKGAINASIDNEHLVSELVTKIDLDSINPSINVNWQVDGADLQALNISPTDTRTKFNLNTSIKGKSLKNLQVEGAISEILAVKNNKPYLIGDINYNASLKKDTTDIQVKSNPLNLSIQSNTHIQALLAAIKSDIDKHFEENILTNDSSQGIEMQLKADLKEAPIVQELLLPKLTKLSPLKIEANFTENTHTLNAAIVSENIVYDGNQLEQLILNLEGTQEKIDFELGIDALDAKLFKTDNINFNGHLESKQLFTEIKVLQKEKTAIQIKTELLKQNDTTYFHINPTDFTLNNQAWKIDATNQLQLAENYIDFRDMRWVYNNQLIEVQAKNNTTNVQAIEIDFQNFKLSTFTRLFSTDALLANGKLNGHFSIQNPYQNTGITADATISDFQIKEVPLGVLSIDAASTNNKNYDIKIVNKGENLNLAVEGTYTAKEKAPLLDFDLNLGNLELKALEKITENYISNTSGNLSGRLDINGNLTDPIPVGELHFNEAQIKINALNAAFNLPKESIVFNQKGFVFNKFTLLDKADNPFILDGTIGTSDFSNPDFNLKVKAKNIQVLNATNEDNELFYGKVNLNTDVSVDGTLNLPVIRGTLMVNESSNFTYVIPKDQVDLIEREGVVLFVNKENPDNILTRNNEETSSYTAFKGYDIDVNLKVQPKATFNIIVDERSGDNLQVTGEGDLNFGIAENGDVSLSGKYEVNDGHYEVSLYNLIKKRFDIAPKSSIVWRGNPLEADMDIRAIYAVETFASGLMATQLSAENRATANQYRQKIPFWVYLNLNGELLQPEISFDIDIPKDERGEFGGKVYSQLQQLNTQEDELNKQVFSLLVFNRFFPSASSDGSNGGSLSIARDNANDVLSDQLNNFSNKIFGKSGLEVDFDLDSYTDYQGETASSRTQLDVNARKKLFNNKLIIEVGSEVDIQESNQTRQNTPLVGTVNIQYLIDENGRWRVKGYRKNEFESVIEGQVILTGIALIFNQEFNKFEELFAKSVKKELNNQQKQERQRTQQKVQQKNQQDSNKNPNETVKETR